MQSMWKAAARLPITPKQKETLRSWLRAHNTPQSVVTRCRIVLMAAEGIPNNQIAQQLPVSRPTVILWRQRFAALGPTGLTQIQKGRGRPPRIGPEKVEKVVHMTLHTQPKGATHWSCRTMARQCGLSPATVQRIWDAHGLKPHRLRHFKLSRDPQFVEKLTDVVGLYLNPPDKALVVCVDEKSQIQALDRSQPGLPLKKGRCQTRTHDDKGQGTTTLFAALNLLEGSVIADCMPRHRNQEFLKFLRRLEREFPAQDLHLILDNTQTHKHSNLKRWLAKRPRFHRHFIPTSSSWLNMIERWFADLTARRIRLGVFHSVPELVQAINDYVRIHNEDPAPFIWTASVQSVMQKIHRCKAIYETLH